MHENDGVRKVFSVDVGNMSKDVAEKFIKEKIKEYKLETNKRDNKDAS